MVRMVCRIGTWFILPLAVGTAFGQDQISRIRAQVAERMARIPNYTCLETIDRTWYADESKGSRIIDRLRLEVATIEGREQFAWPGGGRVDSASLQEVLASGITKRGDFSGFLSAIFVSNSATYTLVGEQPAAVRPGIRYDYRMPRASPGWTLVRNAARATVGYHGSFWVEPETLELARLEVEADGIPPELTLSSATQAIDYGLVAVGAGVFLLPQTADMRLVDSQGLESRTVTRFANCRQFVAESTISYSEERSAEQAAVKSDAATALPAGLLLEVGLTTPIERKTAATGDLVAAQVREELKTKGRILVPKGAIVEGRILRLETGGTSDLLLVRFTGLRFGATQVRLRASVVRYRSYVPAWNPPLTDLGSSTWAPFTDPESPMQFRSGFEELPKGFPLTLLTELVPSE